jgi:patatin-like phospholipase/acyl hydrolase
VLAAVEGDLQTSVADHFDLLAGTSTGGIIAIGIGLGMSPRDVVDLYVKEGPAIFKGWFGTKRIQHWIYRKYSGLALATALRSCFGDRSFGDSSKRLVIPAYNIGEDDVYIFRTPHHERLRRDYRVPAWKAALATSSAPTFFPCTREVEQLRLVDGGVWANNPTMVAVVEAFGTLGMPLSALRVLSIGTTDVVSDSRGRLDKGGIWAWGRGNAAVEVIMRGQSIAADKQAAHLIGRDNVMRLSPRVVRNDFPLDGTVRAADLIGKAAHWSRVSMPKLRERFAHHRASPYKPLYRLDKSGSNE